MYFVLDFLSCDTSGLFISELCGCGSCTAEEWVEGNFCEKPNRDYPQFIMFDPFRDCHTHIKETEIYLETREIEKKFRVYSLSVWQRLICEVKVGIDESQKNVEEIITQCRTCLPLLPQISCIAELSHYFNETRVSWFNFEPLQLLASCLSQEVVCAWEQYSSIFQECCSQRKLREYSGILFCESSEHVFVLEMDESSNDEMTVSQIPDLCACLCRILSCPAVNLHLVHEQINHLLLSFCYCFEGYLEKFGIMSLKQLADLDQLRIVSLRDKNGSFDYNIQVNIPDIKYAYTRNVVQKCMSTIIIGIDDYVCIGFSI